MNERGNGALSRRQALRRGGGLAVAGAGGWLLACGGGDDKGSSSAAPAAGAKSGAAAPSGPRRGGSVTISENPQLGFDPHVLQATNTGFMGMFYNGLVKSNPTTGAIEPDLAERWETPSPTEYVFTLYPNIKWHAKAPANGRALTVQDIIFSYERVRTNDPRFIFRNSLTNVEKLEAVGTNQLKVTLKKPDATTLSTLAIFSMKILNPEVVSKADKFSTAETAVGTGAFVLKSSEIGVSTALERNPTYHKPNLPYLDTINARAFTDAQSEWSAFLSGQLDQRWVPGQDSKKFETERKDKYTLAWIGDPVYFISQANLRRQPWNDPRLPKAMRLLHDHDELKTGWSEVWFGRGRHSVAFAAAADGWDLSEADYEKHIEWKKNKDEAVKEALALFAAAGYTKEKPLKFTLSGTTSNDYQRALVQLMQAQFKRLSQGVLDVDIKFHETATWTQVRVNGEFEYYVGGHSSGGSDPDSYFTSTFRTGGGRNYGKMSDPELDSLIDKQREVLDDKERRKAIHDILTKMLDRSPFTVNASIFILSAAQPVFRDFPPEGPSTRWGNSYESLWRER